MKVEPAVRSVLIQRDYDAYGNLVAEAEIDVDDRPLRMQLEQNLDMPDDWGRLRTQRVLVLRPLTLTLPRTTITKATVRWCVCGGDREISCGLHAR